MESAARTRTRHRTDGLNCFPSYSLRSASWSPRKATAIRRPKCATALPLRMAHAPARILDNLASRVDVFCCNSLLPPTGSWIPDPRALSSRLCVSALVLSFVQGDGAGMTHDNSHGCASNVLVPSCSTFFLRCCPNVTVANSRCDTVRAVLTARIVRSHGSCRWVRGGITE